MINRFLNSNFVLGFVDMYLISVSWIDLIFSDDTDSADYGKAWFNDLTNVVQFYNDYKREGFYSV